MTVTLEAHALIRTGLTDFLEPGAVPCTTPLCEVVHPAPSLGDIIIGSIECATCAGSTVLTVLQRRYYADQLHLTVWQAITPDGAEEEDAAPPSAWAAPPTQLTVVVPEKGRRS